jgi:hypothetical protein
MKVVVIGCAPSEIISACGTTIASLAKEGHTIYALMVSSDESESSSLPKIANVPQLAAIGIMETFIINGFDYSAITQINADAVNSYMKNIKPSLVIMPSWKSPNRMRKILARTSLIACRGIGSILMYELDANNTSFNPTVIFEASVERSLIQDGTNDVTETTSTTDCQHGMDCIETFANNSSLLEDKGSKTSGFQPLEEKFESHRTLLLEEQGSF